MFSKRNLTFIIGISILSVAVVIGAMPAETDGMSAERALDAHTVRVGTVELTSSNRDVRFPGVTRAVERASLAFTIPARVATRPVEVGERVRAGQILASLKAGEYRLANRSAEAALAELDARVEQARRDEARVASLAKAKAATAEELERVQAAMASLSAARDAAAARVDDTRRLIDETLLRAPFDGTVTKVALEPGEWASPGKAIIELSGSSGIELRIEVPESMRSRLTKGAPVEVALPMSDMSATGTIESVSNASTGPGALYPVIIALGQGESLAAGMTAEAVLSLDAVPTITVPLAAVLDTGSRQASVFRIDDGIATRVAIRPGQVVGDRLTVSAEGLGEGDLVAVVGHTALVDGDRVEVR